MTPPAASHQPDDERQDRATPRHNLPEPLTAFVGREQEVAALTQRLSTTRLLTLTGTGGIGKTRLALRVATELVPRYRDGVWLVELAPLAETATIPQAIAAVLGLREEAGRPVLDTIATFLDMHHQGLLILDNCEHLVDGVAAITARLLRACPGLTILATSREALGVEGEIVRQVPPLTLPDGVALAPTDAHVTLMLNQHEATRLFVERAQAFQSSFQVTARNAEAIVQICHHLDGIPLAIELASARVRVLTPQQIAERLDDRFRFLTDASRTALPRQRTLRAVIDWSYDLLTDTERDVLHRLAVFAGGCTLEAADAVVGDQTDTLDALSRLVDKSLVTVDLSGIEARYSMLETIREYALEQLEASGEAITTRRRHATFFLALAECAESELYGPDQAVWADRLSMEKDNLRTALTWTLGTGADPVTALQLAAALGWFWFIRGLPSETRWLEAVLAATAESTTDVGVIRSRAKALCHLGWIGRSWGDPPRTVTLAEESLALSRAIGDRPATAYTLTVLGMLLRDNRDYPRARAAADEGIAIARELEERRTTAHGLYVLASILWYEAYVPVGIRPIDERPPSNQDGERFRLSEPGAAPNQSQRSPTWIDLPPTPQSRRAIELHEEGLAIFRQLGDRWGAGVTLTGGGGLTINYLIEGNYTRATEACTESLDLHWSVRDLRSVGVVLRNFGHVALGQGEPGRAARLIAAWHKAFETIETNLMRTVWPGPEQEVALLRSLLGDETFTVAWEEGRAMSLEQAVAYALRRADPFGDDAPPAAPAAAATSPAARAPSALTPREREVAILVGRGYSNRRIAEALVIAEKTAEVHARNVREKLGLSSRAQIAAWAAQHGLLPAE